MEDQIKKIVELADKCISFSLEVGQVSGWTDYSRNIRIYLADNKKTKSAQLGNYADGTETDISLYNGKIAMPYRFTSDDISNLISVVSTELNVLESSNKESLLHENSFKKEDRIKALKDELETLEKSI